MKNNVGHAENPDYLTEQLITYLGNKRSLLPFIGDGLALVQKKLNLKKLVTFDVFSGSGIVSRYLKQYSSILYANDMEEYARIISSCYLANTKEVDIKRLKELYGQLLQTVNAEIKKFVIKEGTAFITRGRSKATEFPGFVSELYAPLDMNDIEKGERCFYTPYNACYIDLMRQTIAKLVPSDLQQFFIAPLLAEASIHANTGGIFKGFYKDSETGIGKFGGNGENALSRITGAISLPFPIFSNYKCKYKVFCQNANELAAGRCSPHVDVAYIDPPYNQHPYGSNYFMLNLIARYTRPNEFSMSKVSGIPHNWNRSLYNKHPSASETFLDLVKHLDASYLLVSFNNEGFISQEQMIQLLSSVGTVTVLESPYTAFRASRNLSSRSVHVKEYLYVVEKK